MEGKKNVSDHSNFSFQIMWNPDPGDSRGFGFISCESDGASNVAIEVILLFFFCFFINHKYHFQNLATKMSPNHIKSLSISPMNVNFKQWSASIFVTVIVNNSLLPIQERRQRRATRIQDSFVEHLQCLIALVIQNQTWIFVTPKYTSMQGTYGVY